MMNTYQVKTRSGDLKEILASDPMQAAILSKFNGPVLVTDVVTGKEFRYSVHVNQAILLGS